MIRLAVLPQAPPHPTRVNRSSAPAATWADRSDRRARRYRHAMRSSDLDPRTPVLVGVGQCSERIDEPGYQRPLARSSWRGRAAARALADAGADPADRSRPRSTPSPASASSRSPRRSRRRRSGRRRQLPPGRGRPDRRRPRARAVLEVVGGQAPQHLVTELAAAIAAGEREVVLVVGSEAISTIAPLRRAAMTGPTSAEDVGGSLEDRGYRAARPGLAGTTASTA